MSNKYKRVLKKGYNKNNTYSTRVGNTYIGYLDFLTENHKKPDYKILRQEKEIIDLIPTIKKVFEDLIKEVDYGWKNNRLIIFILFKVEKFTFYPIVEIVRFMKTYEIETYEDFLDYINTVDDKEALIIRDIIRKLENRQKQTKKHMKNRSIRDGY